MRPPLALGLILSVLAAGCGGPGPAEPATQGSSNVNVDEGSGSISGTVVDAEILPVEGATVQVRPKGASDAASIELSTDAGGRFLASGLQPGEYSVFGTKIGFREPKPQVVMVAHSNETRVTIVLDRLRVQEPFHESFHYQTAFVGQVCVIPAGPPICQGIVYSYNNPYNLFIDEAENGFLETLVVEMTWTPQLAACSGGMRNDVYAPASATLDRTEKNPHYWTNAPKVRTPTHLLIGREGEDAAAMMSPARTELNHGTPIATTGKWRIFNAHHPVGILGTPVDVACMTAQPVDIWLTTFYVQPAPSAEWSVLENG